MKLLVGQQAPDFSLPDQNGEVHNLSDYTGKWVLVYFYPKDDTPGCTIEACSFRDNLPHFHDIDAIILGISTDSIASHKEFEVKYGLSFTLLADEQKEVVHVYDAQGMLGTSRTSFLVNPQGAIAKIYEKVDPNIHAEQVMNDIKEFTHA